MLLKELWCGIGVKSLIIAYTRTSIPLWIDRGEDVIPSILWSKEVLDNIGECISTIEDVVFSYKISDQ